MEKNANTYANTDSPSETENFLAPFYFVLFSKK